MSLNWNFWSGGGWGGGGVQTKNPPWGEYGYFLEQHIGVSDVICCMAHCLLSLFLVLFQGQTWQTDVSS